MSAPDSAPGDVPDEVPVADAVEQSRPVTTEPEDLGPAPLEADAADWHEQRLVVEIDDEEFR